MFSGLALLVFAPAMAGSDQVPAATENRKGSYWWFPDDPREVAPYKPTPLEVVERMLELAGVRQNDVVYDLGSGDGRILIAAARKFGAHGVGFEINPKLVERARTNVRKAGVEHLVEIRHQDLMTATFSDATVVTVYLLPEIHERLAPILQRELRPGSRVVASVFDLGDWPPDHEEHLRDHSGRHYDLYLWRIPDNPGTPSRSRNPGQPLH
jgi:SAM-dependent methyltransferase